MPPISNDWLAPLKPEFSKPYYAKLYKTINEEYRTRTIYPPADDIFNAFAFTPLSRVKVVILGQDPYHCLLYTSYEFKGKAGAKGRC